MSSVKISIIIPVYNSELYLEQCLDSIINQTLKDIEIICVDDGSTDHSLQILRRYRELDERFVVLTQHNQYAGVARNNGLKKARGKYVLFLDSDDFFDGNMLEKLYHKAESDKTEVLVFDAFQYDNKLDEVVNTSWQVLRKRYLWEGIKAGKDIAGQIFEFTLSAPWNKVFLREYVVKNALCFQPIPRTNDLYFVYAAISCAERIGILNEKLLYYRDNNESSLQGSGECTPTVFLEAISGLEKYLKDRKLFEIYRESFERMALDVAFYNLSNMKSKENYCLVADAIKKELLHQLSYKDSALEVSFFHEIQSKKKIIIYGAGVIAKVLVNYLMYIYGYEKDNIKIVVSDLSRSVKQISGIEVVEFRSLPKEYANNLVVIAVIDKSIQKEIEKSVLSQKYSRIVLCGISEMVAIMKENNR